jgi:hypothetical protein
VAHRRWSPAWLREALGISAVGLPYLAQLLPPPAIRLVNEPSPREAHQYRRAQPGRCEPDWSHRSMAASGSYGTSFYGGGTPNWEVGVPNTLCRKVRVRPGGKSGKWPKGS